MSAIAMELPRILTRVPLDALAAATGRCKRTCSNWVDGITAPSGPDLIALMRHYAEVTDDVLKLAERQRGGLTETQREKLLEAIGEK